MGIKMWNCSLIRVLLVGVISLCALSDKQFANPIDLDRLVSDFVLEEKQIIIPDYPQAFNSSIVRWNGRLLFSFRVLTNPDNCWHSKIGLVWLDDDFNLIGKPQLINTRVRNPTIPSRTEDARLYTIGNRLYIIYNDSENVEDGIDRKMFLTEIVLEGDDFIAVNPECLRRYEGEATTKIEKNWIPFDYYGVTLLAYTLNPHLIFSPVGKGRCKTVCSSSISIDWDYGILRGGTPALKIDDAQYLAFHHSAKRIITTHSGNQLMWHYVMGAYTFSTEPPFNFIKISPQPIVGHTFYNADIVEKKVIFPGGYIYDDNNIWITYGKDDCECWIIKLDREGLMNSLINVDRID